MNKEEIVSMSVQDSRSYKARSATPFSENQAHGLVRERSDDIAATGAEDGKSPDAKFNSKI